MCIVGSIDIINFIHKYFQDALKINTFLQKTCSEKIITVRSNGNNNIKEIMKHLYHDANIYMTRKYERYKNLCKSTTSDIKLQNLLNSRNVSGIIKWNNFQKDVAIGKIQNPKKLPLNVLYKEYNLNEIISKE